ncbi:DUF6909 family protein [Desulfotalea psychrophila]|uniref:Uncharacterized protein n=1 Tax=Desulfotalea psychrophila (strain LSv54 / DSM 12343) TaxID=177439 RepID=Q6AJW1_DESPS|nr:hypothetical protein [Desulfotalea psychrophila]CAG37365.1 hypothetical protein DP2636 [Desulfotalea psychrophila LSv54]
MDHLTKAQRSRRAIATFKTIADAIIIQGYYRPTDVMGEKLAEALIQISPEIYGSMNDPRVVELKGLEYVINRMPRGIEKCEKLVLTSVDDFAQTSFEKRTPLKRRRLSYAISETEMCFIVTRGESEVYDILTHIVFLNLEASKIHNLIRAEEDPVNGDWAKLKKLMESGVQLQGEDLELQGEELDQALWVLSKFLGRSYKETRDSYEYLEGTRLRDGANSSLFSFIYEIGRRCRGGCEVNPSSTFQIVCAPSMNDMIAASKYASVWAKSVIGAIVEGGLANRSLHIISANMHSCRNVLYGPGYLQRQDREVPSDLAVMVRELRDEEDDLEEYALAHGFRFWHDTSGSSIDVQFIDTSKVEVLHPSIVGDQWGEDAPVLLVIDYAFGTQAFTILDEFLRGQDDFPHCKLDVKSISVMGKAGILAGKKGDIMLASAYVLEGTPDNYIVDNDLAPEDFTICKKGIRVVTGSMLTVLGTSLQNSDLLKRFLKSKWGMVGLEMEGAHFQRAIGASIIRKRLSADVKVRCAYYASDNPLISGQTLASGPMGSEGVFSTYLVTRVILGKIFQSKIF